MRAGKVTRRTKICETSYCSAVHQIRVPGRIGTRRGTMPITKQFVYFMSADNCVAALRCS